MTEAFQISQADLAERVRRRPRWEKLMTDAFSSRSAVQAHLAVMREPYLSYVLAGQKSIESRFARVQAPPYERVHAGDLLLLKEVGGPVTALAVIAEADFYVLDPPTFERLRARFASALCATDPEFWEERREARFATLMRLGEILPIEPLLVGKRDRRGWVVLANGALGCNQLGFDLGDPESVPQRLVPENIQEGEKAELQTDQMQLVLGEP
jgi:hypothetical protein